MSDELPKLLEGFVPMSGDQASRFNRQENMVTVLDAQLKQYRAEEELAKIRVKVTTVKLTSLLQEINTLNAELGVKDPREDVKEFEGRLYVRKLTAPEPEASAKA